MSGHTDCLLGIYGDNMRIHIKAFPDIINYDDPFIPDSFYDKWHRAYKTATGSYYVNSTASGRNFSWYIPDYLIDDIEED